MEGLTLKFDWKLKIVENNLEIKRKIIEQLLYYLRPKLQKTKTIIDRQIKEMFYNAIINSPEYKSLKGERNMAGGESLLGHFGFDDGGSKVDVIVNKWIDGINSEIFLNKTSSNLFAGINIYAISESYAEVLGMPEAIQDTKKVKNIGTLKVPSSYTTLLPWLRILLFEGKKTVLMTDHTITFHPKKPEFSRSKQAIMVKSKTRRWFVPEPFAGTVDDNWIIRVLNNDIYPKIGDLINNTVKDLF